MMDTLIRMVFILWLLHSNTIGHFLRNKEFYSSGINFSLNESLPQVYDNVTYYSYHIHVYFVQTKAKQRKEATSLRNRFLNEFNVSTCTGPCEVLCPKICHWDLNMHPIGPHPIGSWGVYIPLENFTRTVSFISMYHGNLTVLIHPNSGHPKIDHMLNPLWIKSILPLDARQLSNNALWPSN